jgi:hypothetical protein
MSGKHSGDMNEDDLARKHARGRILIGDHLAMWGTVIVELVAA